MLRLERDAWSRVKSLRQATNEYPPPHTHTAPSSLRSRLPPDSLPPFSTPPPLPSPYPWLIPIWLSSCIRSFGCAVLCCAVLCCAVLRPFLPPPPPAVVVVVVDAVDVVVDVVDVVVVHTHKSAAGAIASEESSLKRRNVEVRDRWIDGETEIQQASGGWYTHTHVHTQHSPPTRTRARLQYVHGTQHTRERAAHDHSTSRLAARVYGAYRSARKNVWALKDL